MQLDPMKFEHYIRDQVEPEKLSETGEHVFIARGIVGSNGGRVSGTVSFSSTSALAMEGCDVILIKDDCQVEDVQAIRSAAGVLTRLGSTNSETSVLCRGGRTSLYCFGNPIKFRV